MKLDQNFREILSEKLEQNKPFLEKDSLQILSESINSPFRVALDNISSKYGPFKIEFDSCLNCILDTIADESNPKLRLRKIYGDHLDYNEIEFNLIQAPFPHWNSPEYAEYNGSSENLYNGSRKNLEYECEDEFWKDSNNIKSYENISSFSAFNDSKIPIHYINSFSRFIYNQKGWSLYIEELIEYFFPAFQKSLGAGNKVIRFIKDLTPELSLALEFNKEYFLKNLRNSELDISYLNLILFNNSYNFKQKQKNQRDYIFEYKDDILSLGIFGNPFFYRPCFSLSSYAAVEMFYFTYHEEGILSMEPHYFWKKEENGDGTFSLIHPEVYGEKLKKHVFFYLNALAYTSKSYLNYIEKSILDCL